MKSILDRSFRYTPSAQTDLKKTFARIRREQAQVSEKQEAKQSKVTPIKVNHGRG